MPPRPVGLARILLALACLLPTAALEAQTTSQTGGDFTFKRVAPPKSGAGKRIRVQIDPEAEIYRITPGSSPRRPGDPRPEAATQLPPGLTPETPTPFDWYWEAVSPARDTDPSLRFAKAMEVLQNNATRIGTPRLDTLLAIVERHGIEILTATIGTRVSPALVLAVISVESAGQVEAVSPAGAAGLMQLMPATAERFGVTDRNDPGQNIKGGVTYLDWLLGEFGGDPVLALAGYNAGEGAVAEHQGVPPYRETRAYVPKVLAAWSVARSLCVTPPVLVSDGCVFSGHRAAGGN
ncbi:MAG: lytic transglycosylase domain-containing protein [Silicimonas sp.]|nr:lytic transglycosylase domain-containing protein [Silicimonas sp.]